MKGLRFWLVASLILVIGRASYAKTEDSLRTEWLSQDYKSIELLSLLGSPKPLTVQRIRDILGVGEDGEEEDLGFKASTFDIARGHGYTTLYVEGFVFRGAIGFYKVGVRASRESWPRIRARVIDLWKENHGPDFAESDTGLVHTETNAAVFLSYRSAVTAALGEMKSVEIPDDLRTSFDYLTSPIENRAIGDTNGEIAIAALLNASRVDLIENVLKGFNPSGRVYAALALLKLGKKNELVLSADTISTIAKISNLNIPITTVRGCLVSSRTANELLSDPDDSEP
jgi:hypothetical protein